MNKTYHFDKQKRPPSASEAVSTAMIGSKIYHFHNNVSINTLYLPPLKMIN